VPCGEDAGAAVPWAEYWVVARAAGADWEKTVAVHNSGVSPRQQEIGFRFIIEDYGVGGVMRRSEYYKQSLNVDRVNLAPSSSATAQVP
jgi:hypothetical protein